jgi:hypothetical protein
MNMKYELKAGLAWLDIYIAVMFPMCGESLLAAP